MICHAAEHWVLLREVNRDYVSVDRDYVSVEVQK